MQMDTHLDMNVIKSSSSFNVKDLLDLPTGEVKGSTVSPTSINPALDSSGLAVPDVTPPPPYYDPTDNPYTRWLQNNENMHYNSEYSLLYYNCIKPEILITFISAVKF